MKKACSSGGRHQRVHHFTCLQRRKTASHTPASCILELNLNAHNYHAQIQKFHAQLSGTRRSRSNTLGTPPVSVSARSAPTPPDPCCGKPDDANRKAEALVFPHREALPSEPVVLWSLTDMALRPSTVSCKSVAGFLCAASFPSYWEKSGPVEVV